MIHTDHFPQSMYIHLIVRNVVQRTFCVSKYTEIKLNSIITTLSLFLAKVIKYFTKIKLQRKYLKTHLSGAVVIILFFVLCYNSPKRVIILML